MRSLALALTVCLAALTQAAAQDSVTLKLGHFLPAPHPMAKYLQSWADGLKAETDGRITIDVFPGAQLGPVPEYYDMTRRGIVDIGWILHGATSNRFPLTGLIDIPFTVDSAVHGTRILNDPQMRAVLDPEHRGVKVLYLFTHQPAQIHTAGKAVATPADLEGLRIRFPSATAKAFLDEMGAASIGLPPTQIAENLQKNVIDGVVIDYGGAGIAFKLGGLVDHVTEFNGYVTSFGLIMNEDAYASIPDDLKATFDASITDVSDEIGALWDSLNAPGKAALEAGGATIVVPDEAAMAAFQAAADTVGARLIEERGEAAANARALMLELADTHR
ncbi:MAG: TRAP transporter substrate-binding protein [Pseudomonadota bacterium]